MGRTDTGHDRGTRGPLVLAPPALALLIAAAGCAPAGAPPGERPSPDAPALPPVPARTGPVEVDLVYPFPDGPLAATDYTFVFGSAGTGEARVTVNGHPVRVWPNGAFLAFLPVPEDGRYVARATGPGGEVAVDERQLEVPLAAGAAPELGELSVVVGSLEPRGPLVVRRGEPVPVRVRASPGAEAALVLTDGTRIPLRPRTAREHATGFMQEGAVPPAEFTEYVGVLTPELGLVAADTVIDPSPLAGPGPGAPAAHVEVVLGADTVRLPVAATVGVLRSFEERAGVVETERIDGMAVGMAVPPPGTPYHWFFPNGTRLPITGAGGGLYRVQLTDELTAWVWADHVRLEPPGAAPARGSVGSVRLTPAAGWVDVALSTTERIPFRVDGRERGLTITVYGAGTRTNWLYHGEDDPLVERVHWEQASDQEYRLHIDLSEPLWGWMPFWDDGGRLVVRVRRPPAVDPRRPLEGLYIGLDAGHPPGGAIGPTRYTEAEANLAITKYLVAMLRERGARVLETRPDTATVGLGERPQMAIDSGVHVLLSIHNNAFPDGVDPFERNGTSVLYNQPQSLDLARDLQRELLAEFGLRDLGVIWADLALARPTWMPSALTETMFLMIPEQESALRDAAVQERIARAHVRALEAFLRRRAGG